MNTHAIIAPTLIYISRISGRRPDRVTLLLVALSLLGAALVLARTATYGAGQGWDTVNYIGVARNLLDGNGFVNALGVNDYYTEYAPLWPALLAAAGLGLFDPLDVVAPLNAAIFGLTIFVIGAYLRRRLQSPFIFWWACTAAALSIPLIWLASFALSGSLFILMATIALIQCDKYLEDGKTSTLIWAAVFSALAWQTRYVGIALPAAMGLMLLFQQGATPPQRAKRIALYSLIAAAPMVLWLLRNYLLTGELNAAQTTVDYTIADIWDNIAAIAAQGWGKLYLPPIESISDGSALNRIALITATLAALILAPLAYIVINGLWQYRNNTQWRSIIIFSLFSLIFVITNIAGAVAGSTHHGIQSRYLIPLYIPILAVTVLLLDQFLSYSRAGGIAESVAKLPIVRYYIQWRIRGIPLATVLLGATLCLFALAMLISNVREINRVNSVGLSFYTTDRYVNSDTLQHIRENPLAGNVYSNAPMIVYIYTAGDAAYWLLPESRPSGYIIGDGDDPADASKELRQWIDNAPDDAYLVWFFDWAGNYLYDYTDADLRASPDLDLVADLRDGAIFRVKSDAE